MMMTMTMMNIIQQMRGGVHAACSGSRASRPETAVLFRTAGVCSKVADDDDDDGDDFFWVFDRAPRRTQCV